MMQRFVRILFCIVLLGAPCVWAAAPADVAPVAESSALFAMDLYGRLKDTPGNLLFSPFSISTALTMTYAGARGVTAKEMAQVLQLRLDGDALHGAMAACLKGTSPSRGYELAVANGLWGQQGYVFLPAFTATVEGYYDGAFGQVDFSRAPEAADRINAWVAERTGGRIRDMLAASRLDAYTRLVLVNAVYFKAPWEAPFKKIHTQNMHFQLTPQDGKVVAMMNQLGHFPYAEDDQAQVLELPYAEGDLAMMFILPKAVDGLAQVEADLAMGRYQGWVAALSPGEVDVTIPKFRTTAEFDLGGVLFAMGMPGAFSEAADFSGMSDDPRGLLISGVLHRTFIDVTEEGTEAAAATSVVMAQRLALPEAGPDAATFRADHPFLYVIRDRRTDVILFMGRVTDPGVGARRVSDVFSGMWSEVVGHALQAQKEVISDQQDPGSSGGQDF